MTDMQKRVAGGSGFTLIELSVVIVIISLITTAGLAIGTSMVEHAAYSDTQKRMELLANTLKDYYVVNGRLPCVASLSTPLGNSSFGVELGATGTTCNEGLAAAAGTERIDVGGGVMVRVGMLPVRTLGLTDVAAADEYGNRIVYAVTERLTDASDFGAATGAITVQDASDNSIVTDAAYFIASQGDDHKGAYLYNTGGVVEACGASNNRDVLNCILTTATFRDAPFNNGNQADNFFDDQVRWAPKYHLTATVTESSSLWSAATDNVFAVGTDGLPTTGNVGIGTDAPTQGKLHVSGGPIYTGEMWLGVGGDTAVAPDIYMDNSGIITADDSIYISFDGDNSNTGSINFYAGKTTVDTAIDNYLVQFQRDGDVVINGSGTTCTIGTGVGGTACTSDERLKTDITPIENVMDKILSLRGVYYRWNEQSRFVDKTSRHLGVIAQEVQKVFPEAVKMNEDDYLTVSIDALVPALIESVKELDARNKALDKQLNATTTANQELKSQLKEIHTRLEALENPLTDDKDIKLP